MLNTKRFLEMARKWKRIDILGKRRISCSTLVADKGHFILYTAEGNRFMVPISFLKSNVFEELLKMAKEEFGLPRDGPITLPCDAAFLEHVLSLLRRGVMQREMVDFGFNAHCSRSSLSDLGDTEQLAIF